MTPTRVDQTGFNHWTIGLTRCELLKGLCDSDPRKGLGSLRESDINLFDIRRDILINCVGDLPATEDIYRGD